MGGRTGCFPIPYRCYQNMENNMSGAHARNFATRAPIASTCLALVLLGGVCDAQKKGKQKAQYGEDLQAFFKEVDRNYPFFKAKAITKDWKARKARLLKEVRKCKSDADFIKLAVDAVGGLRDGHASFTKIRPELPTRDPDYYPGVVFLRGAGDVVLVAAVPKRLAKKLPVGSIVKKIGGKAARDYLDGLGAEAWKRGGRFSSQQRASFFEYRLPLRGERGTKTVVEAAVPSRSGKGHKTKRKVTLRADYKVNGWLHLYNPPANLVAAARSVYHTTLDEKTGYIWLRRMDTSAEDGIKKAMAAHSDATRWVVDLRGNTGGGYSSSIKQTIAGLGTKVAVILDAGAISAAETFTRDLVNVCKARVFGAQSAGSSSSKKEWTFPSGIATIRYSVRSRSGVGGKPIEFFGVMPDVVLEADPQDVVAGRNTEILAAHAWLVK